MSEEFGPDFITVTDEDGNEFELELVDTMEHNGVTYFAMFPPWRRMKRPASPWMWMPMTRNTVWSS